VVKIEYPDDTKRIKGEMNISVGLGMHRGEANHHTW
jgi:hypothetical protein